MKSRGFFIFLLQSTTFLIYFFTSKFFLYLFIYLFFLLMKNIKTIKTIKTIIFATLFGVAGSANIFAAETKSAKISHYGLPPENLVIANLENLPEVLAAKQDLEAAKQQAKQLRYGEYEFEVGYTVTKNRSRTTPSERSKDYETALSRTFRFPGKYFADKKIGNSLVEYAQIAYGDALHESARLFLNLWFSWQRDYAAVDALQKQVNLYEQQYQHFQKRHKIGDVANIEVIQTQSALKQAQALLFQAQTKFNSTNEILRHKFPNIKATPINNQNNNNNNNNQLSFFQQNLQNEQFWIDEYLKHSHEFLLSKAAVKVAQNQADRASLERLPDPTFGITYGHESNAADRVVSFSVSIPIPGRTRFAAHKEAIANAKSAEFTANATEQNIKAMAKNTFYNAKQSQNLWQIALSAEQAAQKASQMQKRAYQLGEGTLNELLNSQRLALDTILQSRTNQFDAMENYYRLLVDTHKLWISHHENHAEHNHHAEAEHKKIEIQENLE